MKCIRLASHPKDPITQVLDIAQCDGDKTELSGDRTWGLIDEHIGAERLSVLWSQKVLCLQMSLLSGLALQRLAPTYQVMVRF